MKKLFGTVETVGRIPCSAKDAWQTVCFYEHVRTKPSWFLRTVLPIPQTTTGCYGQVGDESRCMYSDGGYLAKRITRLVNDTRIDFDIIEQTIRYHEHVVLRGGTIQAIDDGDACAVRMITRYEFRTPLLTLIRPFVVFTISAMHRFVMRDMLARLCVNEIEFAHVHTAFTAGTPATISTPA